MSLEEMMQQVLKELNALRRENSKIQHKLNAIECHLKIGAEPTPRPKTQSTYSKQNREKMLKVTEVAKYLGVSFDTVRRLMDAGELKWIRIGISKGYRILNSSLIEFEKRRSLTI